MEHSKYVDSLKSIEITTGDTARDEAAMAALKLESLNRLDDLLAQYDEGLIDWSMVNSILRKVDGRLQGKWFGDDVEIGNHDINFEEGDKDGVNAFIDELKDRNADQVDDWKAAAASSETAMEDVKMLKKQEDEAIIAAEDAE